MTSGSYSKRVLSGVLVGMFGLIVVGLGGIWFTFALGLIVHLALIEYFRMTEFTGIKPATKTTLLTCQILLITTYLGINGYIPEELANAVLPLSGAAICGWLLLQPIAGSIADIAASIFGLFYLGFLPSYWIRLRNLPDIDLILSKEFVSSNISLIENFGMIITLISCLMIVASDIGSYFFGGFFGKHPLSSISPSKTIEGAIFGVICAIAVGLISAFIIQINHGLVMGIILGLFVGLFAIVGDLIESMMKRDAGLKDSGDALPGHGGILDRIDSYLFTPAIVYYLIKMIAEFYN
ncbi:phosphatidate cytidylyltransferase [Prochlorococcus marinus]|uniref:phosphatidate cytidylyltransferase n=1 Tax=Prochlorococcus marinus TaxID=1219 RepID=UPI0022B4DA51|nr:CDP-archaeol synthase [Prochlorococcus marinus]